MLLSSIKKIFKSSDIRNIGIVPTNQGGYPPSTKDVNQE